MIEYEIKFGGLTNGNLLKGKVAVITGIPGVVSVEHMLWQWLHKAPGEWLITRCCRGKNRR